MLAVFLVELKLQPAPEGVACLAATRVEGSLATLEAACLEETAEADYLATLVEGSLVKTLLEDFLGKTAEEVYSEILVVASLVKVVVVAYLEPTVVEDSLATPVAECLEAPVAVYLAVEADYLATVAAGSLASPVEDYLGQALAASERQVAYLEIQEVPSAGGSLAVLKEDLVEVSSDKVQPVVEVSLELLLGQCHQPIPMAWVV